MLPKTKSVKEMIDANILSCYPYNDDDDDDDDDEGEDRKKS